MDKIDELRKDIEGLKAGGNTINVIGGEGGGKSSTIIDKTSKGLKYTIKVYSNDLGGARESLNTAIQLHRDIKEELGGELNE